MLYVGRYADNLAPAVRASIADALADRVFIREVAARRRLADDDDFGRVLVIAFGELASRDEPHAHRAEIVLADGAVPRHGPLIGLRRGTAFDYEIGVGVGAGERERRNRGGRLHARQRPDALQKLAVKRGDLITFGIHRLRQRYDGGQYVARVEAGVNALKPDEAFDQQPRADEQRQSQRGLGNHQRVERAASAPRDLQTLPAVAERLVEVGLEKLPDRRHAEQQPGQNRDRQRVTQRASINANLIQTRRSLRTETDQQINQPVRQQQPNGSADHRQQQTLRSQLPRDAPSSSAQ